MNSDLETRYSEEQTLWLKQHSVPPLDGSPETQAAHFGVLRRFLEVGIRMPGTPLDWLAEAAAKEGMREAEEAYQRAMEAWKARERTASEAEPHTQRAVAAAFVPRRCFTTSSSPQRSTPFHSSN